MSQPRYCVNHPDRRHTAKGLCPSCYTVARNKRLAEERRAYMKGWRQRNAAADKKRNRDWKRNNQDRIAEHRSRYKTRQRLLLTMRLFGVSEERARYFHAITSCEICGRDDVLLHIDHNHVTGRVRGRLCVNCNRAIGWLKDDTELLLRAIEYLRDDGRRHGAA